jgi:glutamate 5-kinase
LPLQIGEKSAGGRGGMSAKIAAASRAVAGGVTSVVIANGCNPYSIEQVSLCDNRGCM